MMPETTRERPEVKVYLKILLGVILPFGLFIAGIAMLFEWYSSRGSDYGIVGTFKLWLVYAPSVPGILVMNSLLMTRQWRSLGAVFLVGLIFPTLSVIAGYCLLAFRR